MAKKTKTAAKVEVVGEPKGNIHNVETSRIWHVIRVMTEEKIVKFDREHTQTEVEEKALSYSDDTAWETMRLEDDLRVNVTPLRSTSITVKVV